MSTTSPQSASPHASAAAPATVLVVDDTPENIDVLNAVLRDEYRVKVAIDGERALRIIHSDDPPDLVLLDVMMPRMSGYEVCEKVKAESRTEHLPIIFVTAMSEIEDEAKGFALGAVDYITKPINPVVVRARVKTHIALHDTNRALEARVRERTAQLDDTRLEIIRRLGRAAEFKDNETGLHVIRMSHFSRLIALEIGMTEREGELLLNAAPMHDIGKIGVPDQILLKPGKLDAGEWDIMRKHPAIGAGIIGLHDSPLLDTARKIALTHHEKWDGSGYPMGRKGKQIPLEGRIVAIADVFDALTTARPYKDAWEEERALELIRSESGKHFEPRLVDAFFAVLPDVLAIKQQYAEGRMPTAGLQTLAGESVDTTMV